MPMSPTQIPLHSMFAYALCSLLSLPPGACLPICAFVDQKATARATSGTKRALSSRSRRHISTATATSMRRQPVLLLPHTQSRARATPTWGIIFCQKPLQFIFAANCRSFRQRRTSPIRKSNNKMQQNATIATTKSAQWKNANFVFKLMRRCRCLCAAQFAVCSKQMESNTKRHENIRQLFIERQNSDDCRNFFANMTKVHLSADLLANLAARVPWF